MDGEIIKWQKEIVIDVGGKQNIMMEHWVMRQWFVRNVGIIIQKQVKRNGN